MHILRWVENYFDKNAKNLNFGHFGPKGPNFDSFWPKRWKISKKRLAHFSRTYKPYCTVTKCKVSEKRNEHFQIKSVADTRTDKVSKDRWLRDQQKQMESCWYSQRPNRQYRIKVNGTNFRIVPYTFLLSG